MWCDGLVLSFGDKLDVFYDDDFMLLATVIQKMTMSCGQQLCNGQGWTTLLGRALRRGFHDTGNCDSMDDDVLWSTALQWTRMDNISVMDEKKSCFSSTSMFQVYIKQLSGASRSTIKLGLELDKNLGVHWIE